MTVLKSVFWLVNVSFHLLGNSAYHLTVNFYFLYALNGLRHENKDVRAVPNHIPFSNLKRTSATIRSLTLFHTRF
jgi:hypothetical protein